MQNVVRHLEQTPFQTLYMKFFIAIFLTILIQSCQTSSNETQVTNQVNDTLAMIEPQSQKPANINDTLRIILKINSVPGEIDTSTIQRLTEPSKALAAFYAAMGGTMCDGENCELTTALGLGKQGSEQHKTLIAKYFPNDKVAETVLKQNCYLRPSGASTFSDFEYLSIVNLGDTVKVDYSLMHYNHGQSKWTSGPDVYLFTDNKYVKLKRNLWKHADE